LDFGCGPGRDLHTLKALGYNAVGLEGAPSAAALARVHSGCKVLEQSFLHLELPAQRYDGVFANAVSFHVPSQVLPPGYMSQQRRDVLADVVVARAFPVALGVLFVVRQGARGDVLQVFGTQWHTASFHTAPS